MMNNNELCIFSLFSQFSILIFIIVPINEFTISFRENDEYLFASAFSISLATPFNGDRIASYYMALHYVFNVECALALGMRACVCVCASR